VVVLDGGAEVVVVGSTVVVVVSTVVVVVEPGGAVVLVVELVLVDVDVGADGPSIGMSRIRGGATVVPSLLAGPSMTAMRLARAMLPDRVRWTRSPARNGGLAALTACQSATTTFG
jgi:hypothetical protein